MSKSPNYMVKDIDLRNVDDTTLGEEHIGTVVECLREVTHHYKKIGLALRLPYNRVELIHSKHKTEFIDGTTAIVTEYIRQTGASKYGPPTMWKIVAAVSNSMGGNNHLQAKKIGKAFPPGAVQAITNPKQETFSDFEEVSPLQSFHKTEHVESTQVPLPYVQAQPSASLPILSQHQYQLTGQPPKRHYSDPSGKQSAEFYIGGNAMPSIHEQTGNAQGDFTTFQGDISSQQRRQPSLATPTYQQQPRKTQSEPGTNSQTQGMQPNFSQAQNRPFGQQTLQGEKEFSTFEDDLSLQDRHSRHNTVPAEPTQLPPPHVQARPSASFPLFSQPQHQQTGQPSKRHPSGKQSAEFYIGGDTMPEQQTGNPNQGDFTTSYNPGVISSHSQQRGQQPSGATPNYQPNRQPRKTQSQMVVPGGYHTRGMQPTSAQAQNQQFGQHTQPQEKKEFIEHHDVSLNEAEIRNRMLGVNKPLAANPEDIPDSPTCTRGKNVSAYRGRGRARGRSKSHNSQLRRPGSNQNTPLSHPPLGQGSRTTSNEQSQASTAVGYSYEGFGRNYTTCATTVSVPSVPVSTTPVGNVTVKFDQCRVNQTPPKDIIPQQLAGYAAPPPPQEQSRTPSGSLTSFMPGDSITESSLNSSTCSEPCVDDELPPNKYSKELFKSSYSKEDYTPSKYSQHGMLAPKSPCLTPPEATLGDSHPINPQPPLNTSPHLQPSYSGVNVLFPRSQEYSAGAPPAILQQAANLPTAQASVTSDPTQSQFSTTQSYQTRQGFFEGQQDMSLATMDSIETLSSSNTETMRTLQSEGELADRDTTHELGNSVVASAQSRSGVVSYVKGVDRGAVAKIENSSLVSGIPGSVKQTKRENTVHVYPNKQPMEATNLRAVVPGLSAISNPYQGHTPTPGHYDQHPQLHVRKGPHSIASSKSSQSVDRPYGAKEGAPPATMELVSMDDLKRGDYSDPNFNPDVEREDEPHQQEYGGNLVVHKEPISMASTISLERFSGLHGPTSMTPTSMTPSYVGGKTEHGQCSSIPSSLDASASPQQQANAGSQQQDEVRPSNLSMAGPSEVAGSSHVQQETPLESESILDYQTLLSDSHDGFRPCEDGGNVPFKSYEALQIRGEERYRKVKLKFALLCPQRGQERIISDEDDYPMTSHPHGLALIINNEKFKGHDRREGTNVDETNLTMTLRYLGYNIEIYRDVATKDMIRLFEEVKLRDHSAYDSFICCILTHGESGRVFGADSSSVLIETLTGKLCAASCPSLKGKPKIFFIQACRGKLKCCSVSTDHGHHGNSDSEEGSDHDKVDHRAHPLQDSPSSNLRRAIVRSLSMEAKETAERVKADGDLPDVADFFFGFATPSGQVAWRDLDHGSWYISELCRQLCTYSVSKSLSDVMTKVHDSVGTAYQYRSYKQAPETTSRLRRKVFF